MTIIKNARVIGGNPDSANRFAAYENGIISEIGENYTDRAGDEIIDAGGLYLSPGFIDIHSHGGGGYDFLDGEVSAFLGAAELHASHGTTTIIPTATSGTFDETAAMLGVWKQAESANTAGADMPGLHLEGPYFSPAQCGAQDPKLIRSPKPEEYVKILEAGDNMAADGRNAIFRWSAAPELPGSAEFAKACVSHGVLPAVGHSDAEFDTVYKACENGFTHITHLYSCMSTVHRRNAFRYAGIVESAYLIDKMTSEIIADGVHLPKPLLQMAYRFIGADRCALVTDSMRGAGMPDGPSILGGKTTGLPVIIEDGVAKLPDRSAFAGSVATTDRLVRTMVKLAEIPLADAVKMASSTPARVMRLNDRGTLEAGKRADMILFDSDINVKLTVIGGRTVFSELN